MKTQKREQIITLYTQLATVYDINVSQDFRGGKYTDTPGSIKLKFFLEKTKHLNPGTVIKAINIFSNKKKGLPTPIDIFDIISEGFLQTEENDAIAITQTLWRTVAEYGALEHLGNLNQKEKEKTLDDIKNQVGGIGWKVIERGGGWTQFVKDSHSGGGTWMAQMRDIVKSEIRSLTEKVKLKVKNEHILDMTDAKNLGLEERFDLSSLPGLSEKSKMLTLAKERK